MHMDRSDMFLMEIDRTTLESYQGGFRTNHVPRSYLSIFELRRAGSALEVAWEGLRNWPGFVILLPSSDQPRPAASS
jgi:hypothetical protein